MTETIRTDNSETLKNALLKIKALEEQIERMKKCVNCKHFKMEFIPYWCNKNSEYRNCWEKCEEWELAKN